jgi:hypothetical protein
MIDYTNRPKKEDWSTLLRALDLVHRNAVGIIYVSAAPIAAEVPIGKLVIYDNGTDTRRIYVRTGSDGVGYTALTMI